VFGPYVAYYPNPTKGFNLEGSAGIGPLTWSEGDPVSLGLSEVSVPGTDYSGTGFGFTLGVGYEWFVGRDFSLGPLLRVQHVSGTAKTDDTDFIEEIKLSATSTQVMFAGTYH
jgi:hypothetical protein